MSWERLNLWQRRWWHSSQPVARAFWLSLAVHVFLFLLIEFGHHMKWWEDDLPEWMRSRMEKVEKERRKQQVEMVFVDVPPSETMEEPPR
jgi:hypothetical protein